jgi:hypothetical protein
MKVFAVFLLFMAATGSTAEGPGRVDPHGEPGTKVSHAVLSKSSSCTVCHQSARNGQWRLRENTGGVCVNCHSASPHSGVNEHLKHKVSCLDCHSPHRSDRIKPELGTGFLTGRPSITDAELNFRPRPDAMLKKTCTSCHSWKKVDR